MQLLNAMSDAMSFGAIGATCGRLLDFWEEGMGWQKVGGGACNVGLPQYCFYLLVPRFWTLLGAVCG